MSVLGLQTFSLNISSQGKVRYGEVLVQWTISPSWGIIDTAYAINASKTIGATAVLLHTDWGPPPEYQTMDLNTVRSLVNIYKTAGFKVWLVVSDLENIPTPADIERFLGIANLDGIAGDFESRDPAFRFDPATTEPALIALKDACVATGKKFAYYHDWRYWELIDSKKLSDAGVIVWGALSPWPLQPPRSWYFWARWDASPLWVQATIWNMNDKYTSYDDILEWWDVLLNVKPDKNGVPTTYPSPIKPAAIVFWLTECDHNPIEEQVNAMRNITEAYMRQ
jgi:hypothetical protein